MGIVQNSLEVHTAGQMSQLDLEEEFPLDEVERLFNNLKSFDQIYINNMIIDNECEVDFWEELIDMDWYDQENPLLEELWDYETEEIFSSMQDESTDELTESESEPLLSIISLPTTTCISSSSSSSSSTSSSSSSSSSSTSFYSTSSNSSSCSYIHSDMEDSDE